MENLTVALFDPSLLSFSEPRLLDNNSKSVNINLNRKPLVLETPKVVLPFGINEWDNATPKGAKPSDKPAENKVGGSISYDMSIDLDETKPKVKEFANKLKAMDELILQAALENSLLWFGKKYTSLEIIRELYYGNVRLPIDKKTGLVNPKFSAKLNVKLPYKNLENGDVKFGFETYSFDKPPKELVFAEIKSQMRGGEGRFLLRCSGVWIAAGKFGVTWRLAQAQVKPVMSQIKGFAFRALPAEEIESETESDDESDDGMANSDAAQHIAAASAVAAKPAAAAPAAPAAPLVAAPVAPVAPAAPLVAAPVAPLLDNSDDELGDSDASQHIAIAAASVVSDSISLAERARNAKPLICDITGFT